ncbi:MAG: aspartate 1-decarboxylase [Candidatus Sumerlaeota bacterium]|nr:aspartate 1-decarboxylase [Candidatus Sumerlaeota bacterium]
MPTITLLKSKIHRATVTQADVHYTGSLTLDENLIEAAGMMAYERVEVADVSNGERLSTYIIPGPRGSGVVCTNGAAALKIGVGDIIIIFTYAQMTPEEARTFKPQLVFVDEKNAIVKVVESETHGQTT